MEFCIPLQFEDLENERHESSGRLFVKDSLGLGGRDLSESELATEVQQACFELGEYDAQMVSQQSLFDRLYFLLKAFHRIPSPSRVRLVDALASNLSVLGASAYSLIGQRQGGDCDMDTVKQTVTAMRIYVYFLYYISVEIQRSGNDKSKGQAESRSTGKTSSNMGKLEWDWDMMWSQVLRAIEAVVELNIIQLLGTPSGDESMLRLVRDMLMCAMANPAVMKDKLSKASVAKGLALTAIRHKLLQDTIITVVDALHKLEHPSAAQAIAQASAYASIELGDGQLMAELVSELASGEYPKDTEAQGAKNVAIFLVELAELAPREVAKNVALVNELLECHNGNIRSGVVSMLGKLLLFDWERVEREEGMSDSMRAIRQSNMAQIMDLLLDRGRDTYVFTRCRVLQTWAQLAQERAIPLSHWVAVTDLAVGRLVDKGSFVRRSALALLRTLLEENPFAPALMKKVFLASYEKYAKELEKKKGSTQEDGTSVDVQDQGDSAIDGEEEVPVDDENLPESQAQDLEETEQQDPTEDAVNLEGGIKALETLVGSLKTAVAFAEKMAHAVPLAVQLLGSRTSSDVIESCNFLVEAYKFQVDGASDAARAILPQIFSQEENVRRALQECFSRLYLVGEPENQAKNLIDLAMESSLGQITALEEMMVCLKSEDLISPMVFHALWDELTMTGNTLKRRRGAVIILSMISKNDYKLLASKVNSLIRVGFPTNAEEIDYIVARYVCLCISNLTTNTTIPETIAAEIADQVAGLCSRPTSSPLWYTFAQQAVAVLYSIGDNPDKHCRQVIFRLAESASRSPNSLAKALYFVGEVTLKTLCTVDATVKAIEKLKMKNQKSTSDGLDDEIGVTASREDLLLETLTKGAEKSLILSESEDKDVKSLVPGFGKLALAIIQNYDYFKSCPELTKAAAGCLSKLMLVDAEMCDSQLQLLFTLLNRGRERGLRSDIMVALGDMAVRFPNCIEPWTEHLYSALQDPDSDVRRTALTVVSHLVLNDQLKARGHISHLARALVDSEERNKMVARLFFQELSRKANNPIVNYLPDIISRLTDTEIELQDFKIIAKFLFSHVDKDRQHEGLMEKFLQRLSSCTSAHGWRCIGFCMAQLTLTEKAARKALENKKCFQEALTDDEAAAIMAPFLAKLQKFAESDVVLEQEEESVKPEAVMVESQA